VAIKMYQLYSSISPIRNYTARGKNVILGFGGGTGVFVGWWRIKFLPD
jgi:hypothetical protein